MRRIGIAGVGVFLVAVVVPGLLALAGAARAQTAAEADRLNAEVMRLLQAGKYAEAEPLAKRALALREQVSGPDHPDIGQSLNMLAELYQAQGRYPEAEALFKRGLGLAEKALGPEHHSVSVSLGSLAGLYEDQ
jgi:tetratricopeptide (TPR) repeat protein